MRFGGKEMKDLNINHLCDPKADTQETEDINIKEYITNLIKDTDVLDNDVTRRKEVKDKRICTVDRVYNGTEDSSSSSEDLEIQTNSIDYKLKDTNQTKVNKNPVAKNSKYFINKKYQLYKTEICRSHSEVGYCKYGSKCQFAHDLSELRDVVRHPRYKTETCRTFWEEGSCPYGKRCCFIHVPKSSSSKANLVSDINIKSTPIVDVNLASDIFEKMMFSDMESDSLEEKVYSKNNFIEFKDMVEMINLNLSEIEVSDNDLDYSETPKAKIPRDKYEMDELYVNSLFVQEQKPFWSTNEANLWSDNCLFYIKGINKYHR